MIELNLSTITTLLSIVGGLIGIFTQVSTIKRQQQDLIREQAQRDQELDDRLERIEERLNSHNSYAEKFASLSEAIIEMKTDVKWIKEQK